MSKPKEFKLFVDGEKYEWEKPTVSGAELRSLAGIPDGVEIFLSVPGKPDEQIGNDTAVNLQDHHGNAKFSTQSTGSQAGQLNAPVTRRGLRQA
jgi:hypothetical protein